MSIEVKVECEVCGKEIDESDTICKRCYGDLENEIYNLKEKIEKLENEKEENNGKS